MSLNLLTCRNLVVVLISLVLALFGFNNWDFIPILLKDKTGNNDVVTAAASDGENKVVSRVENVYNGLLLEEQSRKLPVNSPIAVGFGSCLDLIVDAIPLMETLINIKPPVKINHHIISSKIETLYDVADMLLFFLAEGAAAERYIPSHVLQQLVEKAENVSSARWEVGGNAPVMSNRFAKDGFKHVIVGGKASDELKHLYRPSLRFSDVSKEKDDIHLIMEYKVGEKWGNYSVTRANRFVLHSDQRNPYLKSLDSFESVINEVKPRLVIISALQMLDNFPFETGIRESRMSALQNFLKRLPISTLTHFEMASFSEVGMMEAIFKHVLPYVDSVGMNEQELPNIISMLKYGNITQISDSNPRTAGVLDDIRELEVYFRTASIRKLSRIHIHTLAFQVILMNKDSQWQNNRAGVARASLTAHRHVCGVDPINIENAKLLMDDSFATTTKSNGKRIQFDENNPISCWDEDDIEFCIAPVLVCTKVKQTIGGGDNITPAGLMPQI